MVEIFNVGIYYEYVCLVVVTSGWWMRFYINRLCFSGTYYISYSVNIVRLGYFINRVKGGICLVSAFWNIAELLTVAFVGTVCNVAFLFDINSANELIV